MAKKILLLTALVLVTVCALAGPAVAASQPPPPPNSAFLWPFSQGKTMWTYVDASGYFDVDVVHTEPIPATLDVYVGFGVVEDSAERCLAWRDAFDYSVYVNGRGGAAASLGPAEARALFGAPYKDVAEVGPRNWVIEFRAPLGKFAPGQYTLTFVEALSTPFLDSWWEGKELVQVMWDPGVNTYRSTFTVR